MATAPQPGLGLAVLLLMIVVIAPFYWIFSSSIKAPQEIIAQVPTLFPQSFTLQHYDNLLQSSAFPKYLVNSAIVAVLTMVITIVLSSLAAYGLYGCASPAAFLFRIILFARLPFRDPVLVPLYEMLSSFGLFRHRGRWWIVNVSFARAGRGLVLQAFFPRSLRAGDAAALDGGEPPADHDPDHVPLTAPGIASIAIYASSPLDRVHVRLDLSSATPTGRSGRAGRDHRPYR
jgi:ABC-type glycerol-3-phosphate transport system permease component